MISPIKMATPITRIITSPVMRCFADSVMAKPSTGPTVCRPATELCALVHISRKLDCELRLRALRGQLAVEAAKLKMRLEMCVIA
jgi:hypothetical protein